jgi:hypothetical protein
VALDDSVPAAPSKAQVAAAAASLFRIGFFVLIGGAFLVDVTGSGVAVRHAH